MTENNTVVDDHAPPRMKPIKTWIAHGLRCAIVRAPLYDAINGYVQAADDIPQGVVEQIEVHGGVTYEHGRWVGFDTLHSGDIWPGELERKRGRLPVVTALGRGACDGRDGAPGGRAEAKVMEAL